MRAPSTTALPASKAQGRKFMPGLPMKKPTKVCCGASKSSCGVPICSTRPSCMTATFSAKVRASFWSWVT